MSNEKTFEISIPADSDGFVLLQCEYCGEFFKCKPSDIEDDAVLYIHCPSCGLISEDYLTDDVRELAETIVENYANELINDALKKFERSLKSSKFIKVKVDHKPKPKFESPIYSSIDALAEKTFECCERSAKINSLLKMSACYCPFCGGITFEDE